MESSKHMKKYFEDLKKNCFYGYKIASKARARSFDPVDNVEVKLAKNMAERVIGIISIAAPQLENSGAVKRIVELENKYGILDWRVALKIAEEVAQQKFCRFKDEREAMEIGIKTGFAYVTVGVVSSPLEGLVSVQLKDRLDGKGKYFSLRYSGPIRNAGGTAASVSVLIADYIRKKFNYLPYDPTPMEIERCHRELEDYHTMITNLQYFPSKEETDFLMKNIPVEITGDPSEKYEVSNYKDLPRVPENRLRNGYCLIHSSCIPLKAPKLWKRLNEWGKEFDLENWNFLEQLIKIQKEAKSKTFSEKNNQNHDHKIKPNYTYIKDLVAGRPVLGYPSRAGSLRLRYGRSRASGYSGQAIHPCTMHVSNNFIATGTQLKVERPGKAAIFTPCDTIEGPIVKLKDGSVIQLNDEEKAKEYKKEIDEILFLGDVLINYGDFFNRSHDLIPCGYCEEEWALHLKKSILKMFSENKENIPAELSRELNETILKKAAEFLKIDIERLKRFIEKPLYYKPSASLSVYLGRKLSIPLHPKYTFYWKTISLDEFDSLIKMLERMKIDYSEDNIIIKAVIINGDGKRALELLGVPHKLAGSEYIVLDKDTATAFFSALNMLDDKINRKDHLIEIRRKIRHYDEKNKELSFDDKKTALDIVNEISLVKVEDKAGTFIGARMGRPEKAKMRKLKGQPHVLFPVGSEGGKLRSFQTAMEKGKIFSDFPVYFCGNCSKNTVFRICEKCGKKTKPLVITKSRGEISEKETEGEEFSRYKRKSININEIFDSLLKQLKTKIYPDLIKGVRGTSNKDHTPEHLIKGILRAENKINVNKDGTIRYDCSEIALTHFKPKEVHVSVEKLKELGYIYDIHRKILENENQIMELKCQDIILPCSVENPEEPSDEIFFRTCNFIDDLLEKVYGLPRYYNLKSKKDLVGRLVIGLAPHTSAGILGRIIGFSNTQGFLAHPNFHAAMRRDCDGDESSITMMMDAFLNFSQKYLPAHRGSTMDAPLVLTYNLNPKEIDDMAFDVDIVWKYPLELYEAAGNYKHPNEIKGKIKQVFDVLGTKEQFEGYGFTHDTENINAGVTCSAYKTLPTMEDKLKSQMDLAEKIRAVDSGDVAALVIERHFLRDIKGNLRKFSQQQFRCVDCNLKYRRPPLNGKCECGGRIIFTISEGSIVKYLEPSLSLAENFNVPVYLKQSLELLKRRVESMFGKDAEKQEALGKWFG